MMMHVRGSYALGILFADQPGVVYAVRKDSPLKMCIRDRAKMPLSMTLKCTARPMK